MAQLASLGIQQYGHQIAILFLKSRIGIDVNDRDLKLRQARLAAQCLQRGEHIVTEMAIIAAE